MNAMTEIKGPHRVDLHVGGKVRLRRKLLGKSQEWLAETIDLTFQQVQKYERGSNRISSSKLFEIAVALNVPVGYFFDGLHEFAEVGPDTPESAIHAFLMTSDGIELAQAFTCLTDAPTRRRIVDLVKTLAAE